MPLLNNINDKELLFAHTAIHHGFAKFYANPPDGSVMDNNVQLNKIIESHNEIKQEMENRKMKHMDHDSLDTMEVRVFELEQEEGNLTEVPFSNNDCIEYYTDLGFTESEAEEICESEGFSMTSNKLVWDSIADVPANLKKHKGASLTLPQVNYWARVFDGVKSGGATDSSAAAIAWAQFGKRYKKEGSKWVTRAKMEAFIPPPSGDAPAQVKNILDTVYSSCRQEWVDENPDDKDNKDNKVKCAQIAWSVVKKGGWAKDSDGKWSKKKESMELYPSNAGTMDYKLSIHFKGKLAYHVLELENNKYTIDSLPNVSLKSPVTNKSEAAAAIMENNWEWPTAEHRVKANLDNNTLSSDYIVELESGNLSLGALKADFQEYFLPDGSRIVFRYIEETSTWLTWKTMDTTPYVLSDGAIEQSWIPPYGFSGIPPNMESAIPAKYQWWTFQESYARMAVRDEYVSNSKVKLTLYEKLGARIYKAFCSKGDMFIVQLDNDETLSLVCEVDLLKVQKSIRYSREGYTLPFNLISHWWKGPFLKNSGGTVRHYDFVIGDKMFTFTNMGMSGIECVEKVPYSRDWININDTVSLMPKTIGNPMNSTPAWAQSMNKGNVTIYEYSPMMVYFEIHEGMMNGKYMLVKSFEDSQYWNLNKILEKQEMLSKPTNQPLSVKLSNPQITFKGDVMYVSGTAIAEGTWSAINGTRFWPKNVVLESASLLKGVPIGIGTHDDPWDIGVVEEAIPHDDYIWIMGPITDKNSYDTVSSGEFGELSVEANAETIEPQRIIASIKSYDRVLMVRTGACRVCKIDQIVADVR